MSNIRIYNFNRLIFKELKNVFPDYEATKDMEFISDEKDIYIDVSFHCQTVAGQDVLHSFVHVFHKNIENKWRKYIDELEVQNLLYPTISLRASNLGLADSITKTTCVIGHLNNEELKSFVRHLFGTVYKENIDYYRSLENCDKLINKNIEINEEVIKNSSIAGLPFRKVLLAEAVGNPDLPKIKEAMRKYCDEQYEIGKKENFEKLMRLKPVFKKMFG